MRSASYISVWSSKAVEPGSKNASDLRIDPDGSFSMTQEKQAQDTPGRPKSESSRQQTQPNQGAQTGNPDTDAKSGHQPRNDHHVRNEK
jgi:hypothetical protein